MTISYWAEHAWLPDGCHDGVRVSVADGRFTAIEVAPPQLRDRRLSGVVLPGLANGHSHAFHRSLRGQTHDDGGSFWTWREKMYATATELDPDSYYVLARQVYAEMVSVGYTAVGEFHYLHHDKDGTAYAEPNAMGQAVIAAAVDVGIRLTLFDTVYLAGGLDEGGHQPLEETQRRFSDGSAEGWAERVAGLEGGPTVKIGAGVHSVRAVPAPELDRMAELIGDRPLHVHLSEQPAENAACLSYYGRTPTELLDDHGLLGPRTTAIHATHLLDSDIVRLGWSSSAVCFCPTTERDLADGIGPARRLLDAGCAISLGSDQHAVIDPFEELRGLEMHERLLTRRRGRFSPGELMTAAGVSGYRSLGWESGGELVVGAPADFVVVDDDSHRTRGAAADQIGYAATGADVTLVVVDGREIRV